MRRCDTRNGNWLRVGGRGWPLSPKALKERFKKLLFHTCTIADGAPYTYEADKAFDVVDLIKGKYWRRAYLCRYMHQPLSEVVRLTTGEQREYEERITEMLQAQAPSRSLMEVADL